MGNKKGFTLVELLAVIVILAVVMLIAVTAVGPMMTKSRISALSTEGIKMVDAAKAAFQAEQLSDGGKIKATSSVCFDLAWLYANNYYEKGSGIKDSSTNPNGDDYTGSVYVIYNKDTHIFTYQYWLSNNSYWIVKGDPKDTYSSVNNGTTTDTTPVYDESKPVTGCGGSLPAGTVKCTATYTKSSNKWTSTCS